MVQEFTNEQQYMMDEAIADCAAKMRDINLFPGYYGEHVLPMSTTRYLGLCHTKDAEDGVFAIECSADRDEQGLVGTLFHELAHTLPGCQNHYTAFIAACKMTDEAYGTNNELKQMHHRNLHDFREEYRLVLRFTGGVGEVYGVQLREGPLTCPLYEIVAIQPDGRRKVREISTGRTFVADLVEIRALRHLAPQQRKRGPGVEAMLAQNAASIRKQYFTNSSRRIVPVAAVGQIAVVVGDGPDFGSLLFETTGLDERGVHVVCEPLSGQMFPADGFEVNELCYRRHYLAYEAVMREGVGQLPDTWMRCPCWECKDAIASLAAVVVGIWNINDLVRAWVSARRIDRSLAALDARLIDAYKRCWRSRKETVTFAWQAFEDYARHRGIELSKNTRLEVARLR